MPIEHWNPKIQRYEPSTAQDGNASDLFPFERIPCRVFLDTNVISVIVSYGEQIFENVSIPDDVDPSLSEDIEALRCIFFVGTRANWSVFGSERTLQELADTSGDRFRQRLIEYTLELINRDLDDEDRKFAADFGRRLVHSHFFPAIRGRNDRELIGNAIGLGCDVFCTRDRKTILNKRAQLRQMPLRILTPDEWWAYIRPWAALWC